MTIFGKDTSLHDGAVFIQGGKLVAAGCFLPMSVCSVAIKLTNSLKGILLIQTKNDFFSRCSSLLFELLNNLIIGCPITKFALSKIILSIFWFFKSRKKFNTSLYILSNKKQKPIPKDNSCINIEVTQVNQISGTTDYYIVEATVTLVENANGYRLPTEAEWEYAARGGDPTAADWNYTFSGADTAAGVSYSSPNNSGLDTVGWYCYNNITGTTGEEDVTENKEGEGTHEVGKKVANRLGLYDMSGNVFEWCYDYWDITVSAETESDPTGATSGSTRVLLGGSWNFDAIIASVCYRCHNHPYSICDDSGFRVVRPSSN